jgi:hypothetical protein
MSIAEDEPLPGSASLSCRPVPPRAPLLLTYRSGTKKTAVARLACPPGRGIKYSFRKDLSPVDPTTPYSSSLSLSLPSVAIGVRTEIPDWTDDVVLQVEARVSTLYSRRVHDHAACVPPPRPLVAGEEGGRYSTPTATPWTKGYENPSPPPFAPATMRPTRLGPTVRRSLPASDSVRQYPSGRIRFRCCPQAVKSTSTTPFPYQFSRREEVQQKLPLESTSPSTLSVAAVPEERYQGARVWLSNPHLHHRRGCHNPT